MNKRIITGICAAFMAFPILAQVSTTLSPYSQYGLGALAEQSQGFSRGMGGLGIGLRGGRFVNTQNPASYSAVDSLTMLIDLGVTAQKTNFKEGSHRLNGNTASFDYAVASFRLLPNMGVAIGILPFTNIGYSYEASLNSSTTEGHDGEGGLSQVLLGVGWQFAKHFSAGVNFSYLWGDYLKTADVTSTNTYTNTMLRSYTATFSSYKMDIGLQWQHNLNKNDLLTLGAIVGVGHKLGADAEVQTASSNTQTSVVNTSDTISVSNAFSLPWSFGMGVTWLHKNSLLLGVDYSLQKWSSLDYPQYTAKGYAMTSGYYRDRSKVVVGADWVPNPVGRKLYQRVHYRMGVSYATPYYNIKGDQGPKEFSVSAGFGVPVYRSTLNVSGQWTRNAASGYITENTFRINIGLTFNERWFAKWKVD